MLEEYKPCAAMVVTQCIYAALALLSKAAFTGGMSPLVFVVYRQAVATIVLVPVVIAANRCARARRTSFVPIASSSAATLTTSSSIGAPHSCVPVSRHPLVLSCPSSYA
jgi:hypothetical protein